MLVIRRAKPKAKDSATKFADWLGANFVIPSGICRGDPFKLHPFQLDFIRAHLSRDDDGPAFRTCIYSTPRKLGKSTLCGALLLGRMSPDSPIYIPQFRAAITAPTAQHTAFIAEAVLALQEAAGRTGIKFRKQPMPGVLHGFGGTVTLMTGSRTQGHGADLDLALIDETGLLPARQSELIGNFFDALATRDGQLVLTGTRGDAPAYNELIDNPDDRTHVTLHAAPKEADASDPKTWERANPGLGSIKSRRFMADAYAKAQQSGSLTEFMVWHLNMPLSPSRQLLLEYNTLKKAYSETVEPIPGEGCHVGIDLGGSSSMTAAVVMYESGAIKLLGAFPGGGDLDLFARGKRDLVGDLWLKCAETGELHETSGAVTDLTEILPEIVKLIGDHPVLSVSCDRYRDAEFRTAMARAKIDWPITFRGTGPKDGDADICATRRLFVSGKAKLRRSLLLEGSLGEADVKVSATGACQLDKSHPHARIDVAQALCLACSALVRAIDTPAAEYEVEVI